MPQNQSGDAPFQGSRPLVTLFNCQPTAGDMSEVNMQGQSVGQWIVEWGDGSPPASLAGFGCGAYSLTPPADHSFVITGFHTVVVKAISSCGQAEVDQSLLVEVLPGTPPPAAPGARACRGLGPDVPGAGVARQGKSWEDFPASPFPFRIEVSGCRVLLGTTIAVTVALHGQTLASDDAPSSATPYTWTVQTRGVHHLHVTGTKDDGTPIDAVLTFIGI